MKSTKIILLLLALLVPFTKQSIAVSHYKNFKVAVYSRAYETVKMGDNNWIEPIWDEISRQGKG